MQQGMQLGMQLDATGCNQQLQSHLQPVATFSDLSKQGLASPRKVHRWVQRVQKPPCTNFRGLHGLPEAKNPAVSQVANWLQLAAIATKTATGTATDSQLALQQASNFIAT
jgi:uncharacterized pyridoxal phosphate-containing UPF0001 family protein